MKFCKILIQKKNKNSKKKPEAELPNFYLYFKYNSIIIPIICMFAAFNHLIEPSYARKALDCFRNHLNSGGILLIDLHNPQSSGSKQDNIGDIAREMKWDYDPKTRIEKSAVIFKLDEKEVRDKHTMRIYSIDEMLEMVRVAGFSESKVYDGYGFKSAQPTSKNLEVFARLS